MATAPALPHTTPQAFATFLNRYFAGTDGKKGDPVTALSTAGYSGATLGDQWLSFYAAWTAKYGSKYSLLTAEQAFIVLWTEATLGQNIAAAASGGLAAGGSFGQAALTGSAEAASIFSVLQSGSLWLRLAEGLLGIVLIAIGVARITNAVPAATKIARMI